MADATKAWRGAAAAAGVPAAATFAFVTAGLVIGFPITLLVLPFAVPVLALSAAQTKAAARTWQGSPAAARRLRNTCLLVVVVIGSLLLADALRGDDGVIRSDDLKRERMIEKAVVVGLMCTNAGAFALLVGTTARQPVTPRQVGVAATLVLVTAVLAALLMPRANA